MNRSISSVDIFLISFSSILPYDLSPDTRTTFILLKYTILAEIQVFISDKLYMAKNVYITESQLAKIRESAGDLEYHFTTLKGLCGMMETDTFNLEKNSENNRFGKYYMSLSRLRTSAAGYGEGAVRLEDGPAVRIELDGRALNNVRHVNVRPYSYFHNVVKQEMSDEELRDISDPRMGDGNDNYSEFEDSLTLKDGSDQVKDAVDYVARVDILLRDRIGSHMKDWDKFLQCMNMYPD